MFSAALSPVVDRWVPVLEQGLSVASETSPPPSAAGSEYVEKERLHWSGLHAALQVRRPVDVVSTVADLLVPLSQQDSDSDSVSLAEALP